MLVEPRVGSELSPLSSAPWSMEPTRAPLMGGSVPPSLQLSPTGKFKL